MRTKTMKTVTTITMEKMTMMKMKRKRMTMKGTKKLKVEAHDVKEVGQRDTIQKISVKRKTFSITTRISTTSARSEAVLQRSISHTNTGLRPFCVVYARAKTPILDGYCTLRLSDSLTLSCTLNTMNRCVNLWHSTASARISNAGNTRLSKLLCKI